MIEFCTSFELLYTEAFNHGYRLNSIGLTTALIEKAHLTADEEDRLMSQVGYDYARFADTRLALRRMLIDGKSARTLGALMIDGVQDGAAQQQPAAPTPLDLSRSALNVPPTVPSNVMMQGDPDGSESGDDDDDGSESGRAETAGMGGSIQAQEVCEEDHLRWQGRWQEDHLQEEDVHEDLRPQQDRRASKRLPTGQVDETDAMSGLWFSVAS